MDRVEEDFDVIRSRSVEPLFYRAPVPANMHAMEYQLSGVEYGIARKNHLFGDAPGLGKTAECILLGNAIEAKRTLVVCPASLRLNWEREIWKWSTTPNVSTYPVLKSSDGVSHQANYVILSYALLANPSILHAIMAVRWDHLILDEAHAVKDPKGNTRTKVICAPDLLPSVVGRITMASGTILPNQPIECYNAIRLLNWETINGASLEDFREMYYDYGEGFTRGRVFNDATQAWEYKLHYSDKVRNVPKNLADLQYRLRKYVMVRRLKEQVLHELPPKVWHPFPLQPTADIRKALKHPGWKQAEKLYEMDADSFDGGIPVDGAISAARRELGEAKAPAIADYIEDLLDGGVEKLVVAAWHISVLHFLRDKLKHHGLVYMDGGTSSAQKQAAVDKFQNGPETKIILGQTAVIGEGWTLTKAQDVVLAEPDWVPGRLSQAVDRIHRMGQKGSHCIAHVPVLAGSLDERIINVAITKERTIFEALDKQ